MNCVGLSICLFLLVPIEGRKALLRPPGGFGGEDVAVKRNIRGFSRF